MATANPKKPAAAGPADKGLKIVAKVNGFRRAGRAWSDEATTVALSDLTPEQEQALREETMLVVVDVDLPAPAKA